MTGIGRSETCILTVFVLRFLDLVWCPAPKGSLYFVLNRGVGLLQAGAPCSPCVRIKTNNHLPLAFFPPSEGSCPPCFVPTTQVSGRW